MREWMSRLVKAQLAATWQRNHGNPSPALVSNNPTLYLLPSEKTHSCIEVVTHEEETVLGIFLGGLCGMNSYLGGRKSENQPSVSCIHVMEFENIPEEVAIGFGVDTVEDDVGSGNGHSICGRIDCSRY